MPGTSAQDPFNLQQNLEMGVRASGGNHGVDMRSEAARAAEEKRFREEQKLLEEQRLLSGAFGEAFHNTKNGAGAKVSGKRN